MAYKVDEHFHTLIRRIAEDGDENKKGLNAHLQPIINVNALNLAEILILQGDGLLLL